MRLLTFLLVAALSTAAHAEPLTGKPGNIHDGDTFAICDAEKCTKIRVCGIDAPELADVGGSPSRDALVALIDGKTVTCTPVGEGTVCDGRSRRTSRDRVVAQCAVSGVDVAAEMIKGGHACDWQKFSFGHYAKLGCSE